MKRYLYFGEAAVETTGEACMFAVDAFLGMTPASASTTGVWFEARNGTADSDHIVVTHTGTTTKAFMTEIVKYLQNNQRNPFLVVADKTNPAAITSMIKSVSVATNA